MQVADVCDGVEDSAGTEDVGVFAEEGGSYDAGFLFSFFEVRVGEEEEEF